MKSQIFKTAWQIFKAGTFTTFGESLKAAWKRHKLTTALRNGIVYFTFIKEDGTSRLAIGTLREGNFTYHSKQTNRQSNPTVIPYFDIEKRGWRSVRIDRLTAIN